MKVKWLKAFFHPLRFLQHRFAFKFYVPSYLLIESEQRFREAELERSRSLERERQSRAKVEEALRARNILLTALKASEEQYRFLSEAVPQIIWTARPDGNIDYLNSRWTELTGLAATQGYDGRWEKVVHPADMPAVVKTWNRSLRTGEVCEMEFRLRAKDGIYHWHLVRGLPWRDTQGRIVRWVGSCTDMDERKRASQALQDKQNQLDLALTAAKMGTWELDLETGQTTWSRASEALINRSAPQHLDDYEALLRLVHPDDKDRVDLDTMLANAVDDNITTEFRVILKNGELKWIESHSHILRDAGGNAIRLVGVSMDITERKRFENELHRAREAAEEANRAKSSFLANMSHEIRTPLGAVLGFAEILAAEDLKTAERQDAIQAIRRNGDLLAHLINDILDLSKVEAGRMEIEKVEFSLPELIEGVMISHKHLAKEKGLSLEWRSQMAVPDRVFSDPTRLRQILMNLIGNAIKFTDRGHVRLTLSLSGENLDFRIEDTGCGITSEQASRLFESFMQADSSTTRKFGGTGLGLALSRRLARSLGGSLALAESYVGRGSIFLLKLPVEYGANAKWVQLGQEVALPGEATVLPVIRSKQLENVRILLVEDSPDNRMLLNRFLQLAGATVSFAENGREGVNAALANDFDVVLMDIQMPVLDGCQATRELRQSGYNKPILAITAHAMKGEREKILAFGFNDYLTKPINTRVLTEVIAAHFGRRLQSQNGTLVPPPITQML